MKIIVNCSGLSRGGVVQASLSFLEECRLRNENKYFVFLIKKVAEIFQIDSYPENFKFYLVERSPVKSFLTVLKLIKLEREINPDVVFTPFGMSFWKPKSPHLAGFALPFLVYPDSYFFKLYRPSVWFKIEKSVKIFLAKHTIDHIYVENEDMKSQMVSLFNFKPGKVHFVQGAYNQIYDKPFIFRDPFLPPKEIGEFRLVTIAPFFKHKNLIIIKNIIEKLISSGNKKIKFIVTIDSKSFNANFSIYRDYIINVGPIKIEECPILYSECDATFMPTLLESFTAIYPDSMKMGKPIITTNLNFAISVCGEAALYFDPSSPEDAYNKILELVNSEELYYKLVLEGKNKLAGFLTAAQRAEKYFNLMGLICKNRNTI